MNTDTTLIVAEMRASELLATLISALNGSPHWRLHAATLVHEIEDHKLPAPATAALREIDARKRAAECMQDIVRYGDHDDVY